MIVLVCYDVRTADRKGAKRLRRICEACKDFGVRVQFSVFECKVSAQKWVELKARLLTEYDAREDNLRFYFLDEGNAAKTEHFGAGRPLDPTEPLVV